MLRTRCGQQLIQDGGDLGAGVRWQTVFSVEHGFHMAMVREKLRARKSAETQAQRRLARARVAASKRL